MEQGSNKKKTTIAENGIELKVDDIIKGARKFGWICVVLALVFGVVVFAYEQMRYVPRYTAEATFTVSTQNSSTAIGGVSVYSFYYDAATANQLTETFPLILKSNLLQDAVCEDLGLNAMPATLSAKAVEGSNMFTIFATAKDPKLACEVLNAVIDNYPSVAKYAVGNMRFEMITAPTVPTKPSNTNDYLNSVFMAAAVGALLGLGFIVIYAYSRNTVKDKKDVKENLGCEAIGSVPHISFKKHTKEINQSILCTNEKIDRTFYESIRVLRNVFKNNLKENEKIVIGTSTAPSEGKTTVITNLALTMAESSRRVLLVEGDLRNPSVAELLGVDPEALDYKVETSKYKIAYLKDFGIYFMMFKTDNNNFKYMNSAYVKEIFDSIRNQFDIILVDTPPCGLVSDALFFAQAADAAFYVVLQDTVQITKIQSGLNNLLATDINVIGCVLNGVVPSHSEYGYGYKKYGYGYGYGYGKKIHRKKK